MNQDTQIATGDSADAQGIAAPTEGQKRGPKGGPRLSKSQRLELLLQQNLEQAKALKLELEKSKREETEELHAANLKVIKDAGLLDLDTQQWRKHIAKIKAVFE